MVIPKNGLWFLPTNKSAYYYNIPGEKIFFQKICLSEKNVFSEKIVLKENRPDHGNLKSKKSTLLILISVKVKKNVKIYFFKDYIHVLYKVCSNFGRLIKPFFVSIENGVLLLEWFELTDAIFSNLDPFWQSRPNLSIFRHVHRKNCSKTSKGVHFDFRCQFHQCFTYEFFVRILFYQLFLVACT